jgi:hypothetical protein
MTEKDGSRMRSRLRLAALLAGLPIALATAGGQIHTTPAPAATAAHAGPVLDLSGAILVGKGDHGGDRSSHDSGDHRSSHDSGGDRSSHDSGDHRSSHDNGGDRHDNGGDRHDNGGDRHDNGGDRHDRSGDRHENGGDHKGSECHNCGVENGDHRSDDHSGDHNGDHHGGGERGSCSTGHESILEALVDGLCATAETLERGLTGAK